MDRGNPEADLAFLGEAPGKYEDEIGLCFVGQAGNLLDEMTGVFGLTEDDLAIFNVLKCRPPGNKFPTGGIVKKCLPLLDRQIELMSPRVVILTGHNAASYTVWRSYMKAPKMEDLAGRWIWSSLYPTIDFLAMYHTAHTLRQDRRDDYEDEYEQSVGVIEMALDLLEGKQPRQEPLVVGPRIKIEKARGLR